MKRIIALLAPAILALLLVGAPGMAAAYQWSNPGHHPLAGNREAVMNDTSRRANLIKLGLSGPTLEKVMTATAKPGEMRDLVDGEHLGNQLYQSGRMVADVVVAFGNQKVDRRAERWEVRLDDGTVIYVTLPYICQNLSVRIVPPAPCASVRFKVRNETEAGVPIAGNGEDAQCNGYRKLGPHGSEAGAGPWQHIGPGCDKGPCSYAWFYKHAAPLPRTYVGEINDLSLGWYEIRVSRQFATGKGLLGLCLKIFRPGMSWPKSGDIVMVAPTYYHDEGGQLVARVYTTVGEAGPDGLYFWDK